MANQHLTTVHDYLVVSLQPVGQSAAWKSDKMLYSLCPRRVATTVTTTATTTAKQKKRVLELQFS